MHQMGRCIDDVYTTSLAWRGMFWVSTHSESDRLIYLALEDAFMIPQHRRC